MITLVKFIYNKKKDSVRNPLITRTLGKVGLIQYDYYYDKDIRPKEREFWYVDIIREVGAGTPKGCFLLRPLKPLPFVQKEGRKVPDVVRLIPGTFDALRRDNKLLLYPHRVDGINGPNWVLDADTKSYLTENFKKDDGTYEINSIVVVFDKQIPPEIVYGKKQETPILDLDALCAELKNEDGDHG